MNNHQIAALLKSHPLTKNKFVGVYPCNDLPTETPIRNKAT